MPDTIRDLEPDLHDLGCALWVMNLLVDEMGRGTDNLPLLEAAGFIATQATRLHVSLTGALLSALTADSGNA